MHLPNLATRRLGRALIRLDEVDSTNNYAREHAGELPHMAVVVAKHQTAGRGRLGRRWEPLPGQSLMMSVLIKGYVPAALPLRVALGVCEGLEALTGLPCEPGAFGIKWSNDVLWNAAKLCGILCESRTGVGQPVTAIGIGVNLSQTKEDLENLGLAYATSVFLATNKLFLPDDAAAALLGALEPLLEEGCDATKDDMLARYRRRCVTLNRDVHVSVNGQQRLGRAVDIAADGSLICDIAGELVPIHAGEASVRGLMGYV